MKPAYDERSEGLVVVVDDEEPLRDSCRQALSKAGYRVETAANGIEGLDRIEELKPDLALLDLKMPGLGGIDLLEKIHRFDPSIVCVVITGYASVESAVEAMKRHAYDYLPKPFTPDQLRIIVGRGIEKRRLALEKTRLEQEKEVMKRNFITFVSHQLRSPLSSVRQLFDVILGDYVGEVPERQRQLLEDAGERVDCLVTMIKDWLNLVKIESGTIAGDFHELDIASLIDDTIKALSPMAQINDILLKTDISGNLPRLSGNRQSLKELFLNLVSNAITYNRPGGMVTVAAGTEADSLKVSVSDTGIGILEADLPFIFDEFFRVKNDQTRDIQGSGLGLPIARKITEAHRGSITVNSVPGQGTTFIVSLPLNAGIEGNHEDSKAA